MMAAPLPQNEEARIAALHDYHILDTPAEDAYDDIVRLAAFICGTPIAAVSLIDEHRQWFKAIIGLEAQETPRDVAFCAHTILQPGLMVVPNAAEDARFAGNPLVTGDPNIRFYAGMPLVTEEGCALGSLCVIDRTARYLTPEQEAALRTLARQVTDSLELRRQAALQARLMAEREQAVAAQRQSNHALQRSNQALQESAARLVEAQRIAHVGSWELDLATGARAWSEELYRICGLDPAQGPPSEAVHRACYHPDDLPRHDRAMADLLATGCPAEMDARAVLPTGEIRWCHLTARLILDAEGNAVRAVGTAADITERVEREQQVRETNLLLEVQKTQLQAANVELAALATTDPLTGLLNYRAFQARLTEEAARTGRDGRTAAVALLDLNDFRFFNDVYGHAVGDAVLRMVAARLTRVCGAGEAVGHFGGDEFTVLLPDVPSAMTPAQVEARLRTGLSGMSYQPVGEAAAIPITLSVGAALLPSEDAGHDTGRGQALRLAEERLRRAKTGGDVETEADRMRAHAGRSLDGFSMLDALVTAVDNKDRYTRRHSEDVMTYSLMIAQEMGMDQATQNTVAVAALLHDVGKIGVPDALLRKPGRLTDAEMEAVKQHPQMGAIMVNAVPGLEATLDAVRHHHERWDGGGYPFGLWGEETPLMARLMAVADAFSAMTTDRPYRKGMDREKAQAILAEGAGTQWDPHCVQAFLTAQQRITHCSRFKAAA